VPWAHQAARGKQTLVEQIDTPVVQRHAAAEHGERNEASVQAAASRGVATPASPLPFADAIQRASVVTTSPRSELTPATTPPIRERHGADAYATGAHVVLGTGTDKDGKFLSTS
jgi:hypothetical protein